jgi:hypothetical protein
VGNQLAYLHLPRSTHEGEGTIVSPSDVLPGDEDENLVWAAANTGAKREDTTLH